MQVINHARVLAVQTTAATHIQNRVRQIARQIFCNQDKNVIAEPVWFCAVSYFPVCVGVYLSLFSPNYVQMNPLLGHFFQPRYHSEKLQFKLSELPVFVCQIHAEQSGACCEVPHLNRTLSHQQTHERISTSQTSARNADKLCRLTAGRTRRLLGSSF